MNRPMFPRLFRLCLVWVAVLLYSGAAAATIPPSTLEQARDRISPAICILTFTSEITNPQTYETSRQNVRALGLLVSPEGLVAAHGHMATDNNHPVNIKVRVLRDGQDVEYDAKLLQKPDDVNITFLQILTDGPQQFPYAQFQPGARLRLGEPLAVFGILGESLDFVHGTQLRHVSAVLDEPRLAYVLDQSVPFGFIGGPVINSQGSLIGVVGLELSAAQGGQTYTRSGHPMVFQPDLFTHHIANPPGDSERESQDAYLGILTQPLTDDHAEYWGLPKQGGIIVATLVPNSPAADAGLERGDVIVEFNGTPVRAKRDRDVLTFTNLVREAGIGAEVLVKLLRDGEPEELTLTLARRPTAAAEAVLYEDDVFGLTVRELTQDVRLMANIPEDIEGVIVLRVRSGSWAELAGMHRGVIILNFASYPTTTLEEFKEAVAKVEEAQLSEVPVFCRVGPRTGFFRLQPKW